MRSVQHRLFARKARPIQCERDYLAGKQALMAGAKRMLTREEEERLEALVRELICYEANPCPTGCDPAACSITYSAPRGRDEWGGPWRRRSDVRANTDLMSPLVGAAPQPAS